MSPAQTFKAGHKHKLKRENIAQLLDLFQRCEIGQNGIVFNIDLTLLRDPKRFQELCFRLARYEFPDAIPVAETWDGGADVVVFGSRGSGDVVFQCKFTKDLIGSKRKILNSLDTLAKRGRNTACWILCVPVNPSGVFTNWLRSELEVRGLEGQIWAKSELVARLEQHRDVLETFFYPLFSELASNFRSEHLELFKLSLDQECEWQQRDDGVLYFTSRRILRSPDLIFDIILRNTGDLTTAITALEAEVFDRHHKMHGVPGDGLLFPQVTYTVSICHGKAGIHSSTCEPPLIVEARNLQRFKVRITDTGFAWNGGLRLTFLAGKTEKLRLPAMRIFV